MCRYKQFLDLVCEENEGYFEEVPLRMHYMDESSS